MITTSYQTGTKMQRFWLLILVLAVCLSIFVLTYIIKYVQNDEIEILGQHYSATLRTFYNKVSKLHQKPIKVVEVTGHVDNSIEVLHNEVVLRLHRGSTEDNIAHELMHAVLQVENYPIFFSIANPLSRNICKICRTDLDHIVINDRLLEVGYDARQGFLRKAEGYNNVLRLNSSNDPNNQVVLQFTVLHELLKFHYYIGRPRAQTDILELFPQVAKYWQKLSSSIDRLPPKPKPQDMWNIGAEYITLGDTICADLGASIRISDLIGLEPFPLRRSQLSKPAKSIFVQKIEDVKTVPGTQGLVLLRTFLVKSRIMISAVLVLKDSARVKEIDRLTVEQFLQQGDMDIHYVLVD